MRVLVTGGNGQLGHDVANRLAARGMEYKSVDIADFDLTDEGQVMEAVREYQPDAIIHCAAFTAVDRAEEEQALCRAVNAGGTAHIRKAAEAVGAKLMYISTDYVFPGTGTQFYKPDDPASPCNFYGQSKWEGEQALSGYPKLFIVRISWVFGKNGGNFVKTMLRLAETREEVSVVDDQIGSPTYTFDLARLLCDMIVTEKYGVYHATNEGICSWADFAEAIFAGAGCKTRVKRIASAEYPAKAARPMNSRLDKEKLTENGFERLPDWQDALKRYLKEIL
ncbi:dTDP-4-dehydrorhamnose reductase [Christensenellaceae bacterium NSJ-63]|uniref:dTDP-4-dehydrorhamnose reductase n=1 Tax=Guopingia tenuis TaxID=2763656 RepID=A0A926HSI6_9FIRM|nr:dTDP-4-dehydrorhamnose reductase [Guopingia tenuis]MBC8538502.1 dTDP-4-dehydrorhamnose reductase [Guopingia tenuis]